LALDDALKGGLLTQYLRDCLLRDALAPTAGAVQGCANQHIARRVQGAKGLPVPRVTLTGDASLPLEPPGASGSCADLAAA